MTAAARLPFLHAAAHASTHALKAEVGLEGQAAMHASIEPPWQPGPGGGPGGAGGGGPGGAGLGPTFAYVCHRVLKSAPLPSVGCASDSPAGEVPPLTSWHVLLFGPVAPGRHAHGSHEALCRSAIWRRGDIQCEV